MIIDTHVHIGRILNFNMKKSEVLYSMERYGIDYSIVSDIRAAEFGHHHDRIPKILRRSQLQCAESVVDFAKEHPDKIGAALWVRPYEETADEPLYDFIRKNRRYVKAIKVHPFHSCVKFDSCQMEPYIDLAREFSLPIVSHTGGSDDAACIRVYNMAKRHPDVNFVMVHMGLGTDNNEAIYLIGKLDNLYGDTTWVPAENALRFIRRNGPDKLMFGSDNPIDGKDTYLDNGKGQTSMYQKYFHELPRFLSQEDYSKLMYKNAQKVFDLA